MDWKELYKEALRQTDPNKLQFYLEQAEAEMFFRARELAQSLDGHAELQEMRLAADEIRILRVNKLGWPDGPDVLAN